MSFISKYKRPLILLDCGESLTKRESIRDCITMRDLWDRFVKSGDHSVFDVRSVAPVFADAAQFPDLETAVNVIESAQESFETLPALVRAKFDGDYMSLIEFIQDPVNKAECVKMGLMPASVLPVDSPAAE